ncbi:hypothetical protein GCM10023079_28500 [Streptomyces chitinivorans]
MDFGIRRTAAGCFRRPFPGEGQAHPMPIRSSHRVHLVPFTQPHPRDSVDADITSTATNQPTQAPANVNPFD